MFHVVIILNTENILMVLVGINFFLPTCKVLRHNPKLR